MVFEHALETPALLNIHLKNDLHIFQHITRILMYFMMLIHSLAI